MTPVIELSLLDLLAATVLVAVSVSVSALGRLALSRTLLWASVRTTVQLLAAGYLVHLLFSVDSPGWVVVVLVLMLAVAAWTAINRQALARAPLYPIALASLAVGAGFTIWFVVMVVVGAEPWYSPRYLIPLGGIILGNAMNAVALGLERLERELDSGRGRVEAVLALGGSPRQASAEAERQAVRAALTPVINSMMVVGLVQLPGVMTGQILAGADPLTAVRYQIVVMFMLLSGNALSAALAVRFTRARYFTGAWQLRMPG